MPQALKGAAEGIRFVDRINRIYRIRSGPRFGWGRARRRRQEQRIGREGYAAASRRMPPHPGEKGQLVFCLAQRRREVFGRGGWTRLTRRKELFSRKERKERKGCKENKGWGRLGMRHACRPSFVLANPFASPCPEWRGWRGSIARPIVCPSGGGRHRFSQKDAFAQAWLAWLKP